MVRFQWFALISNIFIVVYGEITITCYGKVSYLGMDFSNWK